MKVLVVYEDGDRSDRLLQLYDEVRQCVRTGSMQHQGVAVEIERETP